MAIGVDTDATRTVQLSNVAAMPCNTTPHSVILWFKSGANAANKNIFTGFGAFPHDWNANLTSAEVLSIFFRDGGSTTINLTGSTNYGDGAWHWYFHVRRSSTDWEWYVDGTSQFTSATNLSTVTLTDLYLGGTVGSNQLEDGALGPYIALSASLSVEEARSIAYTMRTGRTIVAYFPLLLNSSPAPEMSGKGYTATLTSTTQADNPPIAPLFGYDLGWMGAFTAVAGHVHSKVNDQRLVSKLRGLVA